MSLVGVLERLDGDLDLLAGLAPGAKREGESREADLDLLRAPEMLSLLEGFRDCLDMELLRLRSILTASLSC